MSELTLRFGEARLHVEGDADLVARERAAFLEHLGRLDRQSEKAGELLAVLLRAGRAPEKAEEPVSKKAEPEEPAEEKSATQDDLCRLRSIHVGFVSPSQLKRAKAEGKLDHLLAQRDEIEVPLDTGGIVTVVCCYVSPTSARFVFKDCWDEGVMNDEATNKTGYFKSKGRKHVLEDIYPHIAAEWREIIVPRTFVETIEGERVEYSDPLWLPSATDVFGTPDGAWWNDGDDDFQLPVFTRERDRVKECGDKGTYFWWLRSVGAGYTRTSSAMCTRTGLRAAAAPTFRMASRRALTSDRKSKKSPVRKRRRAKETAMVTFDICKGNPGALTFVMLAYEYNPYRAEAAFRRMQNNGITGDKLYMLWNDCCDRDVEQALVNMECMSMEEIVSHINYEGGRGIPIPKKENLWWLRSPYPSQMGGEQIDEIVRITRNPYLF